MYSNAIFAIEKGMVYWSDVGMIEQVDVDDFVEDSFLRRISGLKARISSETDFNIDAKQTAFIFFCQPTDSSIPLP